MAPTCRFIENVFDWFCVCMQQFFQSNFVNTELSFTNRFKTWDNIIAERNCENL